MVLKDELFTQGKILNHEHWLATQFHMELGEYLFWAVPQKNSLAHYKTVWALASTLHQLTGAEGSPTMQVGEMTLQASMDRKHERWTWEGREYIATKATGNAPSTGFPEHRTGIGRGENGNEMKRRSWE